MVAVTRVFFFFTRVSLATHAHHLSGRNCLFVFRRNPVAGVVAGAVLDVIEKEHLQAHAKIVGAALLAGFKVLYDKYPFIGACMCACDYARAMSPRIRTLLLVLCCMCSCE